MNPTSDPAGTKDQKDFSLKIKKDPQIFDMIVIVGLVFNLLIAAFLVLYWLDLL